MDYPKDWESLPRHARRKKIKELNRKQKEKAEALKKIRNITILILLLGLVIFFFIQINKKSPEQAEFEKKLESVSLEGKVEELTIEGANHVAVGTNVLYKTNPPSSGDHYSQAQDWGVYNSELDDRAVVHALEHGGIWITYKGIEDDEIEMLESIGKENSQSTIISPRSQNDGKIAIVSWGRIMTIEEADKALIQKYINTYKNQSPEKLAR